MSSNATRHVEELTPAWRELEARTSVKLRTITTDRHYRAMVEFMNALLDDVGDRESHPLAGLLDVVTTFVHDYEERNVAMPEASPAAALRFFMDQRARSSIDFTTSGRALPALEVEVLDELRERHLPGLTVVVIDLAESPWVHSELASHLHVRVRQVVVPSRASTQSCRFCESFFLAMLSRYSTPLAIRLDPLRAVG